MADHGITGFEPWRAATDTGADLLWRVHENIALAVLAAFDDAIPRAHRRLRRSGGVAAGGPCRQGWCAHRVGAHQRYAAHQRWVPGGRRIPGRGGFVRLAMHRHCGPGWERGGCAWRALPPCRTRPALQLD
ncbi:hypothetical protein GCM10010246_14100 [Streptomyces cuspidosporus]|uniref:Uncharacterized protein n=1 Tax=Streptomyces cuspidosporus TaxID=66882 RepID=A0ABP5SM26_9ACTN